MQNSAGSFCFQCFKKKGIACYLLRQQTLKDPEVRLATDVEASEKPQVHSMNILCQRYTKSLKVPCQLMAVYFRKMLWRLHADSNL